MSANPQQVIYVQSEMASAGPHELPPTPTSPAGPHELPLTFTSPAGPHELPLTSTSPASTGQDWGRGWSYQDAPL